MKEFHEEQHLDLDAAVLCIESEGAQRGGREARAPYARLLGAFASW